MVAVSLLAIGLLGSLLFTYRFESERYFVVNGRGNHVGRADVSKYVKEHPEDPFIVQRNMRCAKVTYPSLTLSYSHVDPIFMAEYISSKKYQSARYYYSYVTVNRHASPGYIDTSVFLHGVAAKESFADFQTHVCVYKESDKGTPEPDIEPQLSVDWLAFYINLSPSLETIAETFNVVPEIQYNCIKIEVLYSSNAETLIINEAIVYLDTSAAVDAIWVDSYVLSPEYYYEQLIFICFHVNTADTSSYQAEIVVSVFDKNITVNSGVPPLAGTHLTENGNMKFGVIGNTASNWTLACIDKPFVQNYTSTPYVFISVSFRDKINSDVMEPAIVGWIEFVNEVGFRSCVRRPDFVGKVPSNASIPYLEYLVISEDGIYDKDAQGSRNKTHIITIKVGVKAEELGRNLPLLTEAFHQLLLLQTGGRESGRIYIRHVLTLPNINSVTYILFDYSYISDTGLDIARTLDDLFGNGYFPYVYGTYSEAWLMNIIYPRGQPVTFSEKVRASYWVDNPCPVGPFNNGTCSSKVCSDNDTSGMKTITREKLTQYDSTFCPPLRIEIPCNLPPCTIEERTFIGQPAAHGTNLVWLWALIAVLEEIAVALSI